MKDRFNDPSHQEQSLLPENTWEDSKEGKDGDGEGVKIGVYPHVNKIPPGI